MENEIKNEEEKARDRLLKSPLNIFIKAGLLTDEPNDTFENSKTLVN